MTEAFVDITEEHGPDGREGRFRRILSGPPSWVFLAAVLVNAGLTLVAFSAPGTFFFVLLAAAAGWLTLGVAFVVKAGLALAFQQRTGWSRSWLAAPLVVVAVGVVVATGLPLRAGLATARPAMLEFASGSAEEPPSRVGIFKVDKVDRTIDGGARFSLSGTGFIDRTGFVYAPEARRSAARTTTSNT